MRFAVKHMLVGWMLQPVQARGRAGYGGSGQKLLVWLTIRRQYG